MLRPPLSLADVFSFGVVLWEVRQRAAAGSTASGLRARQCLTLLPPLARRPHPAPPPLTRRAAAHLGAALEPGAVGRLEPLADCQPRAARRPPAGAARPSAARPRRARRCRRRGARRLLRPHARLLGAGARGPAELCGRGGAPAVRACGQRGRPGGAGQPRRGLAQRQAAAALPPPPPHPPPCHLSPQGAAGRGAARAHRRCSTRACGTGGCATRRRRRRGARLSWPPGTRAPLMHCSHSSACPPVGLTRASCCAPGPAQLDSFVGFVRL